ncbi:MAG: hypothetical protein EA415_14005 [Sphaerobacteraceae bacterium]|nr:MAG: hypothetical protein EA415_14005 [Sphaerobacteraceae bacterium]
MQEQADQAQLVEDGDNEQPTDYVYYAKLALGLYFVLWVPGFLINAVYLAQALGEERRTGITPPGRNFLIYLLIGGMVIPVLGLCVLVIISMAQVGI